MHTDFYQGKMIHEQRFDAQMKAAAKRRLVREVEGNPNRKQQTVFVSFAATLLQQLRLLSDRLGTQVQSKMAGRSDTSPSM